MPENLQKGSNLNTLDSEHSPKKSNFKYVRTLAFTPKFGELAPFYSEDVVPSDKVKLRSHFDLRSFNLKSPLMQDINMYKSFFNVPISAILPNNWDKVVETPNIGSKIPDYFGTIVTIKDFVNLWYEFADYYAVSLANSKSYTDFAQRNDVDRALRFLCVFNSFFGKSGLSNYFGFPFDPNIDISSKLYDLLTIADGKFKIDSLNVYSYDQFDFQSRRLIFTVKPKNPVDFIYLMNDYPCSVNFISGMSDIYAGWVDKIIDIMEYITVSLWGYMENNVKFDFARAVAYQLVYNEFYVNDNVDFVYSAKDWRAQMGGLLLSIYDDNPEFFSGFHEEFNGNQLIPDYLSGYFINSSKGVFSQLSSFGHTAVIEYLAQMFGIRRSLLYKDYFTNSRTRPIAVGSTDVAVNNNQVSVIDVTRNIQYQRFLNSVNRTGRKVSKYFKDLFDVNLKVVDDAPIFLAETKDTVYSSETDNTGSAQVTEKMSTTSKLQTKSNKYQFDCYCDKYGVLIGLVSFECERFYPYTSDRQVLKQSSNDYYNPYMQYIGDQPIYRVELDTRQKHGMDGAFGYSTRNFEYKESFPRVMGGFLDYLPTWLFKKPEDPNNFLSPEFIRPLPSLLDDFYIGFSSLDYLGKFNFVILSRNFISSDRPMVKDPQILG